jgi:uncharacterized phage protein gp47/JayE
MGERARTLFGEDINLSERSPLGLFIRVNAWEISNLWESLEDSYLSAFAIYAEGVALDNVVSNFGRERFEPGYAKGLLKIIGDEGAIVPEGIIVATKDNITFKTQYEVKIEDGFTIVDIKAVEPGAGGNVAAGTITEVVTPIAGIDSIINEKPTEGGRETELDMPLRERHLEAVQEPTTGDNDSQYRVWAREVVGVGGVKVKPETPMRGYTTVIITDSDGKPASDELVGKVFEYIDSVRPVNAGIYVKSAIAKTINISAKVEVATSHIIQEIQSAFIKNIEEHFKAVAKKETYVSHGQVGKILLDTEGVIDYSGLLLNNALANIPLEDEETPILGTVQLELM